MSANVKIRGKRYLDAPMIDNSLALLQLAKSLPAAGSVVTG